MSLQDVAFIGIDGAGKSTWANALAERLRGSGHEVEVTSIARVARADGELRSDEIKALYRAANILVDASIDPEPSHAPLLEAGLVDVAASLAFRRTTVSVGQRQGRWIIEETHPLKHVLKELLVIEECSGGRHAASVLQRLVDALLPDICASRMVFVDCPIGLAWERCASRGEPNSHEIFPASDDVEDGFLRLQEPLGERLRELARSLQWWVVPPTAEEHLIESLARACVEGLSNG